MKQPDWGAQFTTTEFLFSLDQDNSQSEHLDSQQQVSLKSSWPLSFKDAAEHIYFQDRDSHERHPVQVVLAEDAAPDSGPEFSVEPREPLPAERTFDLVVDGVRDLSGEPLRHIQVFPLGPTHSMKVNWVGAQNFAGDVPQIVVSLDDRINQDDLKPEMFKIEPPVTNLKYDTADNDICITGDFDIHTHYSVTIRAALEGERGYGLAADSRWGATFKSKQSTVLFPGEQIFERSGRGLRFEFFQVNTPKLTWKLAAIPPEKLAAVAARVREFQQDATDPYSGKPDIDPDTEAAKPHKTELLVDAFGLDPAGSGGFDATADDKEVLREIDWKPADGKQLTGAYLLEVSGTDAGGRIIGNRSLVCFSDLILTQKRTDSAVAVRVAKMSDGMPVPGLTVHLVTEKNAEIDSAVTGSNGIVSFSRAPFSSTEKNPAFAFIADTADGPALQFVDATSYISGTPVDWDVNKNAAGKKTPSVLRSVIITDRNLYRPAQTVEMKGMLRLDTNGVLSIPTGQQVHWWITQSTRDEVLAGGKVPLSADGGWVAQWDVPEKLDLGEYSIHCELPGLPVPYTVDFRVDEYRVPLFSAEVATLNKVGPFSQAKVASAYFHGAPNRGARVHWKAVWTTLSIEGDNNFMRYDNATDRFPKPAREPEEMKSVEGDTTLDAGGTALIKCDSPFTDGATRGRCDVTWRADITSIDGQTLTGGTSATLQYIPALPGIRANEQLTPQGVKVDVDAVDVDDKPAPGLQLQVDLYHVTTKTAKEKIAPFIYRYRNTTTYTNVGTQTVAAPGSLVFPVKDTGDYTAVATAKNQENTPAVSAAAYVSGQEPAEFPVDNETTFKIMHEDRKFVPGENAVLHLEAPFGGMAWVTVETNEILTTMLAKIDGNSGRVEIPIKKEYGPNAFVSVYLVKPGGDGELAQERFAFTGIDVRVPGRELNITTKLEKDTVRPGDKVSGEITVASADQPVQAADITVFAVDDAVLKLGDWALPDLGLAFYPQRTFGVITFNALDKYIDGIKKDSLTEKGFIVGGGGEEGFENITTMRKEFRTLAYWQGSLKTDAQGKIKFEFTAPDNLTSYRIVAVGETDRNQFGGDSSTVVKVSKPLIAEPALPARWRRIGTAPGRKGKFRRLGRNYRAVRPRCAPANHRSRRGDAKSREGRAARLPFQGQGDRSRLLARRGAFRRRLQDQQGSV